MARYKNVNGVRIQFTAEEETIRDAEEAESVIKIQNRIDAQAASDAKKASGKTKLKELGLDDAEIKALTGA